MRYEISTLWNFKTIPNRTGIYKIWNTKDERFYIGSSANIRTRFKSHLGLLDRNRHSNKMLQQCWNQVGANAFEISVLELVGEGDLIERERHWMIKYGAPVNPLCCNQSLPLVARQKNVEMESMRLFFDEPLASTRSTMISLEAKSVLIACARMVNMTQTELMESMILEYARSLVADGE